MNTWPISVRRVADHVHVGIPDFLGDGRSAPVPGTTPSLEEIVGEEWTGEILRILLPSDRAWVWCTQSSIYQRTGLPRTKAPAIVDPATLATVVTRTRAFHPTTLSFVPALDREAQDAVLYWAGSDTEQIPDHIWLAPAPARPWNADEILSWSETPSRWTDLASVSALPAERLVILFDRQLSCALPASTADDVMADLARLAESWNLSVVSGPDDRVWATHR